VPELIKFNTPAVLLALVGIVLTFILLVRKVPGAILISIAAITVLGIPFGVTQIGGSNTISFG
ncbi:MAG TPA: guanine permease, partial [Ruminococcaceae bacterium]|nr:guanine permease [Oscillospiraceae bacterium]